MQTIYSIVNKYLILILFILVSCDSSETKKEYNNTDISRIYNEILDFMVFDKQSILYVPTSPIGEIKKRRLSDIYSIKPIFYKYDSSLISSTGLKIDSSYYLNDLKDRKIKFTVKPFSNYMKEVDLDSIYKDSNVFKDNFFTISKWLNKGNIESGKSLQLFSIPLELYSQNEKFLIVGLIRLYPYSESYKYFYLLRIKDNNYEVLKRLKRK